MSTVSVPRARTNSGAARAFWLAYAALTAVLLAGYATVLRRPGVAGVDFGCFRAASLLFLQGHNPYDTAQLWRLESLLYHNRYSLEGYYNPPLFATVITPLARLPFARGYLLYSAFVLFFAVVGMVLALHALGWTRHRFAAVVAVALSPTVFLSVLNGQQSTLLLCALGAALYALRKGKPGLAGALLAIGWVKPHLLIPVALLLPVALPSKREALRCYAGLVAGTVVGLALTIMTTGVGSVEAWIQRLAGYTGYAHVQGVAAAEAIQGYLPSIGGMSLIILPHPWNKVVSAALTGMCLLTMLALARRAGASGRPAWVTLTVLVAVWVLCTPFVHTNDDVLLYPALAVAWGCSPGKALRTWPVLALWALSTFTLSMFLPSPWTLLGVVPPLLTVWSVIRAPRATAVAA